MTASAMQLFSSLLEARTGQRIEPGRLWRIEASLRPLMASNGIEDFDTLAARLAEPGGQALAQATVDALLNNETYFFRDTEAFRQLTGNVLDRMERARVERKRLRIWSAGCSTGQELYSIAITLAEHGSRWDGWSLDLIGTDISRTAIDRARDGCYSQFEIQRGLPARQMIAWFEQQGDRWCANRRLRDMVTFRQHNILDGAPPGFFDLILCRNVLFYLPAANRRIALDRLARALAPDGALMLGAGETVLGYSESFTIGPEARGLYRLKDGHPERLRAAG